MKNAWMAVAMLAVLTAASAGCLSGEDEKKTVTITMTGSTTVLPIGDKAATIYMEDHSNIIISIKGGGSSVGIADVLEGEADIGMSSREIKQEEKDQGIYPVEIGLDGLAIIVHKDNPLAGLTKEQVKKVYLGEITDWSDIVSGKTGKIKLYGRDNESGTRAAFDELVLDKEKPDKDMIGFDSTGKVLSAVKDDPMSIGYIGLGYITNDINALDIDGIAPSEQTVLSGSYPISRSLYLVTMGKPEGEIKKFIDFFLSDEGQLIVEEEKFVPIK